MYKTAMLCLVVPLLLTLQSVAASQAPTCQSLGKISLRVSGPGFCRARVQASCDAVSRQKVVSDVAIGNFFTEAPCSTARASAAARSVATAIASVWADSLVKVECVGKKVKSQGCGFGQSAGNSLSVAWTEAIAIAVAAASAPDGSRNAFCIADIRALIPALATAFASAQSQLCFNAKGPISAIAFQNAAASSIATAMGRAFAAATASYCGKTTQSECEGEAGSTGKPSAGSSASGSGGVAVPPGSGSGSSSGSAGGSAQAPFEHECPATIRQCCNTNSYPCTCNGCIAPVKFERFEFTPIGMKKHLSSAGVNCFC